MSTAATDPQDRREQAKPPIVSERQREVTVLNLLFAEEHGYPWSVEELVRMIGDRIETVDAVRRLEAAGLLHRLGEFVFPTFAARRADELVGGAV